MIEKCANPKCPAPFHYLRGGRIFRFEMPRGANADPSAVEHFWLCPECCENFTLKVTKGQLPQLIRLDPPGVTAKRGVPTGAPAA